MYSVDLKNIASSRGLTCLFAKATLDESNLWHMRLGHINFKTMNKLVHGNLVRATKDATSGILKAFITGIENLVDHKFKRIRCDNKTKFKNKEANLFYEKQGSGLTWLFDIDILTKSMNYKPVVAGNQSNGSTGVETVPDKDYILLPLWTQDLLFSSSFKDSPGDGFKPLREDEKRMLKIQGIKIMSLTANVAGTKDNVVDENRVYGCADDSNMTNLDTNIPVSPILTARIHKDHPLEQIIRDIHSTPQTRKMTKNVTNHGFEDLEFLDRVYKVENALYGLHQAPRAWPDIMFVICACERFQVTPNVLHLHPVKRIFRYLKGQSKLGLWYPKDLFDLEAYTDSDYAGASLDKSPQQKLKVNVVRHKLTTVVDVNDVEDEVVYEKMHDSMERDASTATSLDWGIINKTQFMTTLNEPSSIKTSSGSGPKRQETIRDAAAQTRSERVSKFSNDPPLLRAGQAKEITNLKKGVKRLERKKKSRFHGLKRLYKVRLSERVESSTEEECLGEEESSKQGRIEDIDADDNITLVNDQEMFDADRDLQGEETISTATLITTDVSDDELTMAQALVEIKKSKPNGATTTTTTVIIPTLDSTRPKARGVVMQELSETLTTTTIPKSSKVQDKGKDYELVARLQEEEQGELTIKEKSRLFVELINKRKKHFSKLKA
nr:uncharacterized mitochondrial protein AtMg00810-like [Tanacetum cinerariifolium]